MGGDSSKDSRLKLDLNQWQKLQERPAYDIMRNKNNGRIGELHHFVIPQDKDLKQQKEHYINRLNQGNNTVNVIGTEVQNSGFGFCGSQKNAKVMTERIPTRLSEIQRLNKQQEAGVLYNAIKGFGALNSQNGPFDVTPGMIGFNQQGQTKTWLNQNYGMNFKSLIQKTRFQHLEGRQQNTMINNILDIVDEKCQGGRINHPLRSQLQKRATFAQAADCISHITRIPHENLSRASVRNLRIDNFAKTEVIEQPVHKSNLNRVSQVPQPQVYHSNLRDNQQPIINQTVSHTINQSASQPIHQSVSQPVHQSVHQPVSQSIHQPVSQSINQPVSQTIHQQQPVQQSFNTQSSYLNQPVVESRPNVDSMAYNQRTSVLASNPISHQSVVPTRSSNRFSFAYQGTPSQIR